MYIYSCIRDDTTSCLVRHDGVRSIRLLHQTSAQRLATLLCLCLLKTHLVRLGGCDSILLLLDKLLGIRPGSRLLLCLFGLFLLLNRFRSYRVKRSDQPGETQQ
jgi:hypothetical protein